MKPASLTGNPVRSGITLGVVLAGGFSSRMGGDKAFLELNGVPMWRKTKETLLQGGVDEVWFSRAAVQNALPGQEKRTLVDAVREGPFPAVLDALEMARDRGAGGMFLAAVDMPFLSADWVRRVLEGREGRVRAGVGPGGLEPFGSWIPAELAVRMRSDFQQGQRSLKRWMETLPEESLTQLSIEGADQRVFRTCNSPQEWAGIIAAPDL